MCPDNSSMVLVFSYLITLGVVTVKCQVNLNQPIHGIYARWDNFFEDMWIFCHGNRPHLECIWFSYFSQLVAPEVILRCLYPGDVGLDSPNLANQYQLESAGIGPFSSLLSTLGSPYIWAQRAAGLDFLNVEQNKQTKVGSTIFIWWDPSEPSMLGMVRIEAWIYQRGGKTMGAAILLPKFLHKL